jgi:hypothetical protein
MMLEQQKAISLMHEQVHLIEDASELLINELKREGIE